MGKKGGASPAKRNASRPVPAGSAASAEQHANVLVEQFRRELAVALQPALEESTPPSGTKQEIAYYGIVAEKLVQIGGRLERLAVDQMSLAEKVELLLEFGDKLYRAQEYHAASVFFYERVLQFLGIQPGQRLDPNASDPPLPSNKRGQIYVRCAFGVASCSIQTECRCDPYVRHTGTLERLVNALGMLQQGIETAVRLEKKRNGQLAWLILNGSLAVFSAAKPLVALGFAKEVVGFLKWCLVALESSIMLSTIKYVLWKLQLCAAICDCYEAMTLKEPLAGTSMPSQRSRVQSMRSQSCRGCARKKS